MTFNHVFYNFVTYFSVVSKTYVMNIKGVGIVINKMHCIISKLLKSDSFTVSRVHSCAIIIEFSANNCKTKNVF